MKANGMKRALALGLVGLLAISFGLAGLSVSHETCRAGFSSLSAVIPIGFGQVVSGSIQPAGASVNYTFSADAGDVVLIRMVRTSGDFWPGIRLYGPDGSEVARHSSSSTAEIYVALAEAGEHTVLAYDSWGAKTGDYSIYFSVISDELVIITNELPAGLVGVLYEAVVEAAGGIHPYTWEIMEGTLPYGLGLDLATGVITGVPAAAGQFNFTIEVTDAAQAQASKELLVIIAPLPADPVRALPATVMPGQEFEVTVTFISPGDDFNSAGLSDVAPAGWSVSANRSWCTPAADVDWTPDTDEVNYVWYGPYAAGVEFTAVYKVVVPPGAAPGTYSFPGGMLEYYIAGTGPHVAAISGDSEVEVVAAVIEGEIREVNCGILPGVTVTLYLDGDKIASTVSNENGYYTLAIPGPGEYTVVVSKEGFRDWQQSILIDELTTYTVDFVGDHGLVPNAPEMSYVLACINLWQFGEPPCKLTMSTVLAVINAWQFPTCILSISSTQGGSVTSPGEGVFTYNEGAVVDLVAEAEEGYEFLTWTGDVDTIDDVGAATTAVTIQVDGAITAVFAGRETSFWHHQTDGLYGGVVTRLAVDSSGSIFAGTYGAGMFRSIDGGESWSQISLPSTYVNALAISSEDVIFADRFRSVDNGETWEEMPIPANPFCFAIAASGHLFAATWHDGILRSTDNGETWTHVNTGLTDVSVRSIAIDSLGHIFAATAANGVFRSADNGENWTQVSNGLTDTSVVCLAINSSDHVFAGTYQQGVFYSTDSGESWASTSLTEGWVYCLVVDSSDHVFAGIWRRGVWRSTDNGATWDDTGPADTAIRSLVVSQSGHIFAGTDGEGVFRSPDSGESWMQANKGLANAWVRCLASNSLGDVFAGTWNNGIFRSADDGENWTNAGLPKKIVDSLAISSSYHIFAGTKDIFLSIDNGENWIQKTFGLTNLTQYFAVSSAGHIFAATQNGVFRSDDSGETWVGAGLQDKNISALGTNSLGHVFAGVWGSGGGVYRSMDNGQTWINVGLTEVNIRSIAIDSSGQVFVGTGFGEGVFSSTDNGETWVNVGLKYVDSYCLVIDSLDRIFVGTIGHGVFYSAGNGLHWQEINGGLTDSVVMSLVINSSGYLFAGTNSGVFRSVHPVYEYE